MWKLLLLFNILLGTLAYGQESQVSEKAIFRLGKDIYFLSDLGDLKKFISNYKCVGKAKGLSLLELDDFLKTENLQKSDYKKLMYLEKVRKHLASQRTIVAQPELLKNCKDNEVAKMETFMRNRFFAVNESINQIEFQKFKEKNPTLSNKKLRLLFEEDQNGKRKQRLDFFLKSLDKKIEHFEYY